MKNIDREKAEEILQGWYNHLMDNSDGMLREFEIQTYLDKLYGEDNTEEGQLPIPVVSKCLCPEPDRIIHKDDTEQCGICWKYIDN